MKIWRIQLAHGMEVSCPSIHRNEETVKEEVTGIIRNFLLPSLRRSVKFNEELSQYPEWVVDGKAAEADIVKFLEAGDTWAAYDRWHELEDKHANTWTYPIWVKLGTVIVETREWPGPTRKIPIMPRSQEPPYLQFDPGEGAVFGPSEAFEDPNIADAFKKLKQPPPEGPPESPEMGAIGVRRWRIYYADFGGRWHPSVHTSEEMVLSELEEWLGVIVESMDRFALTMEYTNRCFPEFTQDMRRTMSLMAEAVEAGNAWEAYTIFKEFESRWPMSPGLTMRFPLWCSIGTVVVDLPGQKARMINIWERRPEGP